MRLIKKIKRGPAIVLEKDIGLILAYTNIDKNSIVLDAGSGTGFLTINLARFVKKVYSYERDKRWVSLVKENIKRLDIKNVIVKEKDIYKGITEKALDLITLDLPEPERVLKHAKRALKKDSYLVAYLPNITQVISLVKKLTKDFKLEKVTELIERDWDIDERVVRPKHMMLAHTAFLVFIRKL